MAKGRYQRIEKYLLGPIISEKERDQRDMKRCGRYAGRRDVQNPSMAVTTVYGIYGT